MNPFLAALLGAAPVAVAAFVWHRRTKARHRDELTRLSRDHDRRAEAEAERHARAKQTLSDEVASVRTEMLRVRERNAALRDEALAAAAERAAPRIALDPCPRQLAEWLSQRLATIVSGIEGGTFQLIESSPAVRGSSHELESLWLAIKRLRRLHDKVQAYTRSPSFVPGSTPLDRLLSSIQSELAAADLGFQIAVHLPPDPVLPIRGDLDQLTAAATLACDALRQLERRAMRLSIGIEPCFDRTQPELHLELVLERDDDTVGAAAPPGAAFLVARAAAQNLLLALGGGVAFSHEPGQAARALIRAPFVVTGESSSGSHSALPPSTTDEPVVILPQRHRYGGVIVIESDQAVRAMLATELKAHGRAVFACADCAAARALLLATPERFEILVVDHESRLAASEDLAATLATTCADVRVFVLSETGRDGLPPLLLERVTSIRKPFGVHELRRALVAALSD